MALNQLTQCCAIDLAKFGIRVNAINSGMVKTPILGTMGFSAEEIQHIFEVEKDNNLVGEWVK